MEDKEINKLITYIKENYSIEDYEIEDRDREDTNGISYRGIRVYIKSLDFSAIWVKGSYGYEGGLIEIMCSVHFNYDDGVRGYLTAEQCIGILKNYEKLKSMSVERDIMIEKSKANFEKHYRDLMNKVVNWE